MAFGDRQKDRTRKWVGCISYSKACIYFVKGSGVCLPAAGRYRELGKLSISTQVVYVSWRLWMASLFEYDTW